MTQYSGVYTLQNQGQAITSGQWATDPYYKNTTLLLHADGVAGGAQNNTFLDSSTNSASLTRGGSLTQGSFSPYGSTWSNYFPSGSMLSTAPSGAFSFSTGDFCIESWVNVTGLASIQTILSTVDAGISGGYSLVILTSGFLQLDNVPAQTITTNSNPIAANTWMHVALTKSSGTYRIFVNGISCSFSTNTMGTTLTSASGACVGKSAASGYEFPLTGYMSNVRVVKGSAIYTSNFAPSTSPLTNVSGTSLLTCQSNSFIDNSSNYFSMGVTSSPSVQRFSPFPPQYQYTSAVIGGSAYNSGAANLTTSYSGSVGSTADFTVEGWFYVTGNTDNGSFVLCSAALGIIMTQSGQKLSTYIPSVGFIAWQATALVQNTWHYIVVQRSSSTMSCYLNGTRLGTQAGATGGWTYNGAGLYLTGSSDNREKGYYTDIRISTIARYSGTTMTVPTAPLTSDANTTILLSMTNAGIYDNAMMTDLETVGNAQVSTSVVKYGSGSLAFDGSGDYLQAIPNAGIFNTGDFTVEAWIYPLQTAIQSFVCLGPYDSNGWAFGTGYPSSGVLFWYRNGAGILATTAVTQNTWQHVAVCRANGVSTMFINGVQVASAADTVNYSATTLYVGTDNNGQHWKGYLDDVRITKGLARYTGNFIPPQVAMPNQ